MNPLWLQIVSDIAELTSMFRTSITRLLWDAFLAGVGIGVFSGTSEILKW